MATESTGSTKINLWKLYPIDAVNASMVGELIAESAGLKKVTVDSDIRGFFFLQDIEPLTPSGIETEADLTLGQRPWERDAVGKCLNLMSTANDDIRESTRIEFFFPPSGTLRPLPPVPHLGYDGFDYIECKFQVAMPLVGDSYAKDADKEDTAYVRDARIVIRLRVDKAVNLTIYAIDYEWRPVEKVPQPVTIADLTNGTDGKWPAGVFYDLDLTADYILPYYVGASPDRTGALHAWKDIDSIFTKENETSTGAYYEEQAILESLSEFAITLIMSLGITEDFLDLNESHQEILLESIAALQQAQIAHLEGEFRADGSTIELGDTHFNARLDLDDNNTGATFQVERLADSTLLRIWVSQDYENRLVFVQVLFRTDGSPVIDRAPTFDAIADEEIAQEGLDLGSLSDSELEDLRIVIHLMDEERQIFDVLALAGLSDLEKIKLTDGVEPETTTVLTGSEFKSALGEIGVPELSLHGGLRTWGSDIWTERLDRNIWASDIDLSNLKDNKVRGELFERSYLTDNPDSIWLDPLKLPYVGRKNVTVRTNAQMGEWDFWHPVDHYPVQVTHSSQLNYLPVGDPTTLYGGSGRRNAYNYKVLRMIRANNELRDLHKNASWAIYKALWDPTFTRIQASDHAMLNGKLTINAEDIERYVKGGDAAEAILQAWTTRSREWIELQLKKEPVTIQVNGKPRTYGDIEALYDDVGTKTITPEQRREAIRKVCQRIERQIIPNPTGLGASELNRLKSATTFSDLEGLRKVSTLTDAVDVAIARKGYVNAYRTGAWRMAGFNGTMSMVIELGTQLSEPTNLDLTRVGGAGLAGVGDAATFTLANYSGRALLLNRKSPSVALRHGFAGVSSGLGGAVFEFVMLKVDEATSGLQYSNREYAASIGAGAIGGYVAYPASIAGSVGGSAMLGALGLPAAAVAGGGMLVGFAAAVMVASVTHGAVKPYLRELTEKLSPPEELIIGPSLVIDFGLFQAVAEYFTEDDQIWVVRTGRYQSSTNPFDGSTRIIAEVTESSKIKGRECEVAKPFFAERPESFFWPVDQLTPTNSLFETNRRFCDPSHADELLENRFEPGS